ncbi:hypothetical protein GQX73_g2304 [Xylaria multiplex]|uniref:Fungal N-terminal domain-containing protein n=1 Tax=Xylaria multiplex TaxID=323545 RepID=A0A7C8MWM2_9PEZI|nr:hypothetical protein GQX73_g2304 [Xylaria multiplex]
MGEAPTIAGTVAAVAQLTSELVNLTTTLRHHLKSMRKTPENEVQWFLMEMSNFTGLLNFFTELADRPIENMARREQKKQEKRVFEIQQQCTYIYSKMEYLVDRFAVLAKGNMTPLEGIIEKIKYLLDKPDIKDLRLSVQAAALTVNCTSTLFLWEEASINDDTRTVSLLEQLRNLLPMAKKASTELAEYQQKHGTKYESGAPDPNNAMLAASEEIQRQIAHAIRPHSSSEAAKDRSLGHRHREKRRTSPVIERTSQSGAWSSPFGPNGMVADSVEYLPRRKLNRVSFKESDYSTERLSSDRSMEIRPDSSITQAATSRGSQSPPIQPPSPTGDNTSYTSERGSVKTSSKGKQVDVNKAPEAHHETRPKPSRDYYAPGISDPMKPLTREESPESNTPRGPSPLPESEKASTSAGSSYKDARFSPVDNAKYSLPAPTESEESGLSDREPEYHWSRTNLAPPSSKSTSPSSGEPRAPETRRRRNSIAVRPAESRRRKTVDLNKGISGVPKEQLQQHQQERHQDVGPGQGQQSLEVLDKQPKEERRRRNSSSTTHESHILDGDASFREGRPNPSPYVPAVPAAPLNGPSGRRRPRRPRPQTMLEVSGSKNEGEGFGQTMQVM